MANNHAFLKRSLLVCCLALASLSLAVAGAGAAKKPKPMGYIYSQCTSKTDCTYQGFTNVKQTTLSLSASKLCSAGASALGHVGTMKVKSNGKIAIKKTVTFQDFTTYKNETVTVEFNGKLKKSKSVKGTLKITTTASDCVDDTGKSNDVNLKYKGAYYGG